ncbi:hypothetical protein [Flavobacterium gilvum]|nr:hypothetical protein [Flavobacterium gilvum]
MKNILKLLSILTLFITGNSCSNNDDPTPPPSPTISYYQAGLATLQDLSFDVQGQGGLAVAKLNKTDKTILFIINYSSSLPFTPTSITLAGPGNAGQERGGESLLYFLDTLGDKTTTKTFTLTDEQIVAIKTGRCFFGFT